MSTIIYAEPTSCGEAWCGGHSVSFVKTYELDLANCAVVVEAFGHAGFIIGHAKEVELTGKVPEDGSIEDVPIARFVIERLYGAAKTKKKIRELEKLPVEFRRALRRAIYDKLDERDKTRQRITRLLFLEHDDPTGVSNKFLADIEDRYVYEDMGCRDED